MRRRAATNPAAKVRRRGDVPLAIHELAWAPLWERVFGNELDKLWRAARSYDMHGLVVLHHEFVAVNAALVLQALLDTNVDLRVQSVTTGIHRGADDGRERGRDEELATDDYEDTLFARIA